MLNWRGEVCLPPHPTLMVEAVGQGAKGIIDCRCGRQRTWSKKSMVSDVLRGVLQPCPSSKDMIKELPLMMSWNHSFDLLFGPCPLLCTKDIPSPWTSKWMAPKNLLYLTPTKTSLKKNWKHLAQTSKTSLDICPCFCLLGTSKIHQMV